MKIRNGFVSNSSSSSFIVAFNKYPENADEMRKLLFGNSETIDSPWKNLKYSISTKYASEIIFSEMKELNPGVGADVVNSGYHDYYPEYDWKNKDKNYSNDFHRRAGMAGRTLWNEFVKKNEGKKFFVVEFSDNESREESLLEHGNVFEKVPHLVISHH